MNINLNSKHPFYSANDFYRALFNHKLIKLAIDGGFTCPNRDGTLSNKGCIFCSGKGSGDFAGERSLSIDEQYKQMLSVMSEKWSKHKHYIAYFQAFTNTYAPVEHLRELYLQASELEGVEVLSIATRPDCLSDDVIALLSELNKKIYVIVELGLQTTKPESIELINRCYENEVYKSAVARLKAVNINVVTHIILGLPNELFEDMLSTVNYAVDCGTDGIKLQLLHIIKDTPLYSYYMENPFHILEYDEYVKLVVDLLELTPPNVVIHRITGDGAKATLYEPRWSLNKRRVLNGISGEFIRRNSWQGIKK